MGILGPVSNPAVGPSLFGRPLFDAPSVAPLPLVHMTNARAFREMLRAGSLQPKKDDVFSEDLLFLFYGRPTYRIQTNHSELLAAAPVLILFNETDGLLPRRVLPFDSGAFANGRYGDDVREMALRDFEGPADLDTARHLIEAFFGSNEAYLRGSPAIQRRRKSFNLEEDAYLSLLRDESADPPPIEVQFDRALALQDNVALVIAPDQLFEDPELSAASKRFGFKVTTYDFLPSLRSKAYSSRIADLLFSHYRELGIMGVASSDSADEFAA